MPARSPSPKRFGPQAYGRYRKRFNHIDGWIDRLTAEVLYRLSVEQVQLGCRGSIVEIGIHHGKSFIPLYLGCAADESAIAIDLFEDQGANIDGSGKGDLPAFLMNVELVCGSAEGIHVLATSSLDVEPASLLALAGPARITSIDGGHTTDITRNDLQIAQAITAEDGVIVLDDVFNPFWPGVMSGLCESLRRGELEFVPFAIVPGKLLFSKPEMVNRYKEWLRQRFGGWVDFGKEAFGAEVLGLGVSGYSRRRALKNTPLGQQFKRIVRGHA